LEWALQHDALSLALGELPNVLTPEEVQTLLADAELSLFSHQPEVSDDLIRAGWFLHAVGSSNIEGISQVRRQRAFRISAHILELARLDDRPRSEKLELAFGSALGYRRGGLDPNAMAVFNQSRSLLAEKTGNDGWSPTTAIEAGIYLLSFRTRESFDWLREQRAVFAAFRNRTELRSLRGTMFGPSEDVIESCYGLLRFLIFGDQRGLEKARGLLNDVVSEENKTATINERWVAAHLISYSVEMESSSIWTALPETVPAAARRALTSTSPPVLTLWEPQRNLFAAGTNRVAPLLSQETKRTILSVPTSAGKTLIAQIIVLAELAREERSVCLVAPQRSLVREIRRSLLPRVRALRKNLNRELPDFSILDFEELAALISLDEQQADVDILTPERFAAMLRFDTEAVLSRYSLFIFDEAHLVGDSSRGFTLEGALSYLHWKTRETDHRIVLMSAAIGNEAAFQTWLEGDTPGTLFKSDWRGPRRLTAAFTTRPQWDEEEHLEPTGRGRIHRLAYPLDGVISFSIPGAGTRTYSSREPIGRLVFRRNDNGTRGVRDNLSTPHYSHVASLAVYLEHAGPILAVTGTRLDAQRLARAIASETDTTNATRRARDAVASMLAPEHPLVEMLSHGVAYHHAGLPLEVLALLEDELREGRLKHLVSTTTLTEGVNLPVHTVILAETQWNESEVRIIGPRMLNAIGRAGRAGIETEGWVVFAPSGQAPHRPEDHLPSPEQLEIHSQLANEETLEAFTQFETQRSSAADAVFSDLPRNLQDFTSFIWYVLACEETLLGILDDSTLDAIINSLFLSSQVDHGALDRIRAFARDVRDTFADTDPESRKSWARAGTRISSAKRLDELGRVLAQASVGRTDRPAPVPAVEILSESGVLSDLLILPEVEANAWRFRESPRGADVEVNIAQALIRWISGEQLAAMADALLPTIENREWRLEQVVDHVSRGFGHSVSWMIANVIERANLQLKDIGAEELICPALPLYVRYGVNSRCGRKGS
jgi:DEAD/DEAH box helicase/Helicase conserved C-terminal domain